MQLAFLTDFIHTTHDILVSQLFIKFTEESYFSLNKQAMCLTDSFGINKYFLLQMPFLIGENGRLGKLHAGQSCLQAQKDQGAVLPRHHTKAHRK